jgi:Xaa-Pro aminopeptidase
VAIQQFIKKFFCSGIGVVCTVLLKGFPLNRSLVDFIEGQRVDAYLVYADSVCDADLYYLTRFLSNDSFLYLHHRGGDVLMVSDMEVGRAEKQARVDEVVSLSRYDFIERVKKSSVEDAVVKVLVDLLGDLKIERVAVPHGFGVHLADALRAQGFEVVSLRSPIRGMRAVKDESEISFIRDAQKAAEVALQRAEEVLKCARVKKGVLHCNGEVLTSEKLRSILEVELLLQGYAAESTIVACGELSADPHNTGSGPLQPGEPIVIDVFPRHKVNRYYGDVSRTFVYGTPKPELVEMYEAVLTAQQHALSLIRAGVNAGEVHAAVCEMFESAGYDVGGREGFVHSTGHGLGLEVHELPSLGVKGEVLKSGNVVTVEPGLYYRDVGGVRIEDAVVVREADCVNLNSYHKKLVIEGSK